MIYTCITSSLGVQPTARYSDGSRYLFTYMGGSASGGLGRDLFGKRVLDANTPTI